MTRTGTLAILTILLAIVAAIGLGVSLASFATRENFGGMMNGGMMPSTPSSSGPGLTEWAVLVVSAILLVLALALFVRRERLAPSSPRGPPSARTPAPQEQPPAGLPLPMAAAEPPVPETTLVKLLDEDERRMYLEIRDHGGTMLQRDLVALGTFSKAKVTRVLDKLEAKGVVLRERHGMTNRVRIVAGAK